MSKTKYPEKDGKKECIHCHQVLDITNFSKAYPIRKDGTYPYIPWCKSCHQIKYKETSNRWRDKNREKVRLSNKQSYKNAKDNGSRYQRLLDNYNNRYNKDIEKSRIDASKRKYRAHILLTDGYIKATLSRKTALSCSDIPESLVKLKREQLILTRKLRNHE